MRAVPPTSPPATATITAGPAPTEPRPSRLIAEALVQRHGPRSIVDQAASLGLPAPLTRAMVAACGATAVDPKETNASRRPAVR